MTIKSTVLIAVTIFFCLACNNRHPSEAMANRQDEKAITAGTLDSMVQDFQLADTSKQRQETGMGNRSNVQAKPIEWDKKIVKTARLNVEVKDYKDFSQLVSEKVKKYGEYISQEEQSQSDYQIQNSVMIKVPVEQFENAVNDLTKDVSNLNEKNISSEDVTTQLVDGKSRLEAKKQVRLRYLDLLKQARNMEEILTVQKQINDIQEDIELVNGRMNTLSHESAMSTINLTFFQIINANAKADREKEPGFLLKVKQAFANGWYWIGELFVGLISVWPLWVALVAGIWFYKRRLAPVTKQNSQKISMDEN